MPDKIVFKPFVSPETNMKEFSVKAIVMGCIMGCLFGAISIEILVSFSSGIIS